MLAHGSPEPTHQQAFECDQTQTCCIGQQPLKQLLLAWWALLCCVWPQLITGADAALLTAGIGCCTDANQLGHRQC